MDTTEINRKPLFIVSFHRSGSSLTAHMFHAAGMHLGTNLLGAKPSNPYGHFENTEVIAINERILQSTGHTWYKARGPLSLANEETANQIKALVARNYAKKTFFGMKDPRFCLTIRHWAAVLGGINVLFVHRGGQYCVSSLWNRALRDYRAGQAKKLNHWLINNPDHIAEMYAHYMDSFWSWFENAGAERNEFIFARYEDIVSGADNIVHTCREKWGYDLREIDVADFYDEGAVTSSGDWNIEIRDAALKDHILKQDKRIMDAIQ